MAASISGKASRTVQTPVVATASCRPNGQRLFAWTTPCFGSQWALHALDIPFTFGNHDIGRSWDEQDSQALRDAADPEGHYRRLNEQMMAMWTTFARTGNPSIAAVGNWPAYTPEHRHTMVLDGKPHLMQALREGVRAAIMAA
jgi:para-nitrobenzyl esterase